MRIVSAVIALSLACEARADADVPRVATDIAPVYALVSQIMEGVGEPDLIVPLTASPHSYAMRPSQARALSDADVVFWVGESLTPWLHKPLDTLAGNAKHVSLIEADGLKTLGFREGATFDAHDHDHGGSGADDHADTDAHKDEHAHEDDHAHDSDHAHADEHAHDEDHAHEEDHAHHHEGGVDPHAWLDPQNGAVWLGLIAEVLAAEDPTNASLYRDNAARAVNELKQTEAQIDQTLEDVKGQPFVVLHDAFHYFENRFGVEAVASISIGDGTKPSAARLAEVRERIQQSQASCILMEPEQAADLGRTVADDAGLKMAVVSPLSPLDGELGADSYRMLLLSMADAIKTCLTPVS